MGYMRLNVQISGTLVLLFSLSSCSFVPKFGDPCDVRIPSSCGVSNGFTCGQSGKCECELDRLTLNHDLDQCVSLLNAPCVLHDKERKRLPCPRFADCWNGVCKCSPNYLPLSNDTCERKPGYGGECANNTTCDPSKALICGEENKCVCHFGEIFDGFNCRVGTGNTCPVEHECVFGAACNSQSMTCECIPEMFIPTGNGTCEKLRPVGGFCDSDLECNYFLRCGTENNCVCNPQSTLDLSLNKCRIHAGAKCKIQTSHLIRDMEYTQLCVHNAICNPPRSALHDKCECGHGFQQRKTNDGFCYAQEGTTCNGDSSGEASTAPCLPGLVCREGTCKCLYDKQQEYEPESEKCLNLLETPCNNTNDCKNPDAECSPVGNGGLLTCQCKRGLAKVDQECQLKVGAKCSSYDKNSKTCDKAAGLECGKKGVCECPPLHRFDLESVHCKGLPGAYCDRVGNETCVDGALCTQFRGVLSLYRSCVCIEGLKATQDGQCVKNING